MAVELRLAREDDAAALHAIYTPIVEQTIISFELVPPSVEELRERIRSTLARWPWLVCAHGDMVLGYAYASAHRARQAYQWAADVSVYVHPQAHRSGIGRGLYTALLRLLVAQGYFGAYAGIALPNPASVRLHESVGFRPVGVYAAVGYKLGAWHDVGWWQCELQPRTPDPAPPRPIAEVQGSDAWHAACSAGRSLIRLNDNT